MRKPSKKANPEGPYELLNDAKAKPGYDRDALEKMELLTILEQRLANLLGMQGDLRKLDILIGLLTDHFLGRSTTMSSLTGASKLSYSTAYRAIEAMIGDGAILRRAKTKSGKTFSLHPSPDLLAAWHLTMAEVQVRSGRKRVESDGQHLADTVIEEVSIGPLAVLAESVGLSRGLRLLMHADPTIMAMHALKRQFELNLGVGISLKALSIDKLDDEICRNAGRKVSEFDIIACDMPWFGDLIASNQLLPLSETAADIAGKYSDFYPDAIENVTRDGKIYGIPILTTAEMLVYREDLFSELELLPPRTTLELLEVSSAIMSNSYIPYGIAWNGARGTAMGHTFMTLMAAHGCPIVDLPSSADGFGLPDDVMLRPKANFHRVEAEETLEFLCRLLPYSPPNVLRMNWYDRARSYARGDVGMAYSHTLLANLFELDNSSVAYGSTGYVAHPTGRSGTPVCPLGGYALAIPKNIEPSRIEGARKAINALTSPEAVKLYVTNGSLASTRYSVNSDPEVKSVSPVIQVVDSMSRNRVLRMWPRPPVRGIKSIITIAGEEVHDALMGKKTLKEALETAQNRSEKLE